MSGIFFQKEAASWIQRIAVAVRIVAPGAPDRYRAGQEMGFATSDRTPRNFIYRTLRSHHARVRTMWLAPPPRFLQSSVFDDRTVLDRHVDRAAHGNIE